MGNRLKGKGTVVTGAGRGIGREIALALAAEGAKVVVVDPGVTRGGEGFDAAPADEVVAEIKKRGGTAIANHNSVADFEAAEEIIKSCVKNFGRLDILVNVAGILRERMVFNMTTEDWDMVLKVHLYGTFNMSKCAAILMRQQRSGRIINTTSTAWLGNTMGQSNYAAAKGGIVSFTGALARELGKYGVTCNVLSPGAATRMTVDPGVIAGMMKRYEAGLISKEQAERAGGGAGPEHVPPMVVYLCTDEAADINGQIFQCTQGTIGMYSHPQQVKQIFNNGEIWSLEQLIDLVPKTLLVGYTNPRPAEKLEEKTS